MTALLSTRAQLRQQVAFTVVGEDVDRTAEIEQLAFEHAGELLPGE
jgi:hypothetical protein